MPIAPGTKIGPYEIQAPLGEGGMGAVYQAHDPTLQRTVAIKVLAKQDADASARLLQEARAASALNHPHICTIYEVGEATPTPPALSQRERERPELRLTLLEAARDCATLMRGCRRDGRWTVHLETSALGRPTMRRTAPPLQER